MKSAVPVTALNKTVVFAELAYYPNTRDAWAILGYTENSRSDWETFIKGEKYDKDIWQSASFCCLFTSLRRKKSVATLSQAWTFFQIAITLIARNFIVMI